MRTMTLSLAKGEWCCGDEIKERIVNYFVVDYLYMHCDHGCCDMRSCCKSAF